MAVVNTGLLTKGLRSEFFARLSTQQAQNDVHTKLATSLPSKADSETYKFLGSVPQMREWGTGRVAKGMGTETYTVENLKYESTIEVDRDEIADDQTGQIMMRVQELAERAATHKDFLLGQLILNGSSAGFNSYDGVPFFDSAHKFGDSTTSQSNELTFNVGDVTGATGYPEPDNVENAGPKTLLKALGAAISAMMLFTDDRDEAMHRRPTGLVIVCHQQYLFTWMEAIKASFLLQTDNVQGRMMGPEIIAMPELTDISKFFLFKTDGVVRPFLLQDREPIEFSSLEQGSETGFNKEVYLYGVRARYRLTYGYWSNAISMDLTT